MIFERRVNIADLPHDIFGNLRLSSILALAESSASLHTDQMGITNELLLSLGVTFFIIKQKITVNRYPKGKENVTVTTQAYQPFGAQYSRTTKILDEAGNELVVIDARWALIDIESRKILRRPPENLIMNFDILDERPKQFKFALPEENLKGAESFTVTFTDLDRNGHVNNTVYADFICNILGNEMYSGAAIKELTIFYSNEAKLGEKISPKKLIIGDKFWITAENGDKCCFEADGSFFGKEEKI